jgi:hypothetical protein
MRKTNHSRLRRDNTAEIVAGIHGVTADYVRKVRNGERENEAIMATLVDFNIGKSNLIKHLEQLVPLTQSTTRYGRKKN